MKVKELIEQLQTVNPDLEVVMSKDGEGNNFSPFSDLSGGIYTEETTWYGEFTSWVTNVDEDGWGLDERQSTPEEWNAICLWPVN